METKRRPRILLVKPVLPYPPDQGTKLVTYNLIRELRDHFDITLLARILSPEEREYAKELEKWCERVITVLAPNRRSRFHRLFYGIFYNLKSSLLRHSLKSLYDCPGAFLDAARRLSQEAYDLVVLEYWQIQQVADFFPEEKIVLLTHDVDMLVNREISLIERELMRKLQAVRRWLLEQKEEVKAYRRFRRIVALTERDRDTVKRISGADTIVEVLPFSLDSARYEHPGGERRDREVLFVGAMGATFNRDAVDFLIRRICPRLDHIEGLTVTIVGGDLPGELSALASGFQAEVVGSVEDIRPFLYRASCLVVPLRFGGGLRIRIIEAMLAGLPVVCSRVAIAGMPFEAGEDYLLAETPDEFAGQIEALVKDGELGRRLAESARRRALRAYGDMGKQDRAAALFRRFIDS